jgi:hypothetical protein
MLGHCLSVTVFNSEDIIVFVYVSLVQFLLFKKMEFFVDRMLSPCRYMSATDYSFHVFVPDKAYAASMPRENHFNATDSSNKYNTHSNL